MNQIVYLNNSSAKSEDDMEKLLLSLIEKEKAVFFLNVHLNWNDQNLDNNYGFEVANLLRTKYKSTNPIILYSPIPKSYFEALARKEDKYKILYAPGTYFVELTFEGANPFEHLPDLKPISSATLHDVATMLISLKGYVIDRLNHDLKFNAEESALKAIAEAKELLNPVQLRTVRFEEFAKRIKRDLELKDSKGFEETKQQFIKLLSIHLTETGAYGIEERDTKFKILFVDDEPEVIEMVQEKLGGRFDLVCTNNSNEAIRILERDELGHISAIISDWRLYEDVTKTYWQEKQGYEVLTEAAKLGTRALFSLTSQADFVVHQLRNELGIRFQLFKKEHLRTQEQWDIFSDMIYQNCVAAHENRASILDEFGSWKKNWEQKGIQQPTLKEQYIEKWNSLKFDHFNTEINIKADEMWSWLQSESSQFKHLIGEPQFSEFGLSNKVFDLYKFLVIRRVWIGLFYKEGLHSKAKASEISDIQEQVYNNLFGRSGTGSVNQKTLLLCLQNSKMNTSYFFPEEIQWLRKNKFKL
jgi:CheY-like chemotaxis protein